MTTTRSPEFHYCANCGFLAEGGRDLKCSCIHARPMRLNIRPEQINEVRDAIARGDWAGV